jgi:hypothetical protein
MRLLNLTNPIVTLRKVEDTLYSREAILYLVKKRVINGSVSFPTRERQHV